MRTHILLLDAACEREEEDMLAAPATDGQEQGMKWMGSCPNREKFFNRNC
jgi:hypothetical protein